MACLYDHFHDHDYTGGHLDPDDYCLDPDDYVHCLGNPDLLERVFVHQKSHVAEQLSHLKQEYKQ